MTTSDQGNARSANSFGCIGCWPSDADAAWDALPRLKTDCVLVDESHFMMKVRSCKECAQQYLSVFTETIDWVDGEDPQYWSVLPLTAAEAERLSTESGTTDEVMLALPGNRQCLRRDYPKGQDPKSYWSHGLAIGRHD